MKQVKNQKKLAFNKVTVRHLNEAELGMAAGGGTDDNASSSIGNSKIKTGTK